MRGGRRQQEPGLCGSPGGPRERQQAEALRSELATHSTEPGRDSQAGRREGNFCSGRRAGFRGALIAGPWRGEAWGGAAWKRGIPRERLACTLASLAGPTLEMGQRLGKPSETQGLAFGARCSWLAGLAAADGRSELFFRLLYGLALVRLCVQSLTFHMEFKGERCEYREM